MTSRPADITVGADHGLRHRPALVGLPKPG